MSAPKLPKWPGYIHQSRRVRGFTTEGARPHQPAPLLAFAECCGMRCTTCGRACFWGGAGKAVIQWEFGRRPGDRAPRCACTCTPHTARDLATRTTTNRTMDVRDYAPGVRAQYHHYGAQPPSQPLTPLHGAHVCAEQPRQHRAPTTETTSILPRRTTHKCLSTLHIESLPNS